MADVVLEITIPDSKVAIIKAAVESIIFNGEVQTGAVVKAYLEEIARDDLKGHINMLIKAKATKDNFTEIEPYVS